MSERLSEVGEFQRYESSHRLLASEFNALKIEQAEWRKELFALIDENKKLRGELKDVAGQQLAKLVGNVDVASAGELSANGVDPDRECIKNLEKQLALMKNVSLLF